MVIMVAVPYRDDFYDGKNVITTTHAVPHGFIIIIQSLNDRNEHCDVF